MKKAEERTVRKPYLRPHIEEVKLVPEEAVLSGCKTATAGTTKANVGIGCLFKSGGYCNVIAS